jgi:hypothetical protein
MPNLLHFIRHVMLVLQCKYGVPYCLCSFVIMKRSVGAGLAKIMKNANVRQKTQDSARSLEKHCSLGKPRRHLGCLGS